MGTNGNQKSTGKRARTRELYSKAFKTKGVPALTRYLKIYRIGDIVDIKCDPSIQNGMPYKCYHGKTGRVWNVTPRAVGVFLNKRVGCRYIMKKLLVRTEHVQHSTSRDGFLNRVKANDAAKTAAKKAGRASRTWPSHSHVAPRGARGWSSWELRRGREEKQRMRLGTAGQRAGRIGPGRSGLGAGGVASKDERRSGPHLVKGNVSVWKTQEHA